MIVVSDSSPLIALDKIGRLYLYAGFLQPSQFPRFYTEVVVSRCGMAGADSTAAAKWIHIQPLPNTKRLTSAQDRFGLGTGELSVIILAQEIKADLVLLDDFQARTLAQEEGLKRDRVHRYSGTSLPPQTA